jgi:hypothetical protein
VVSARNVPTDWGVMESQPVFVDSLLFVSDSLGYFHRQKKKKNIFKSYQSA